MNSSATRRSSTEYSMTQDCVEWDESKNLDLRSLTSPDVEEDDENDPKSPQSIGDDPPASKKKRTSDQRLAESGRRGRRRGQRSIKVESSGSSSRDPDQEINEIFSRLDENDNQRSNDRSNAPASTTTTVVKSVMGAPTPRLDNKSSSRQMKTMDLTSRMVTWSGADIDRRRQQREAAIKHYQRRQRKAEQTCFITPQLHHQQKPAQGNENVLPNMLGPSGFEGLLKQVQTPQTTPPRYNEGTSTPFTKPAEDRQDATTCLINTTLPKLGSQRHGPDRLPLQPINPQTEIQSTMPLWPTHGVPTLDTSVVQPVLRGSLAGSHQMDGIRESSSVDSRIAPTTNSVSSEMVEFDDIEFSADDLEAMDSLVLAATSFSQERTEKIEQSQANMYHHKHKTSQNQQEAMSASTAATTTLSVQMEQNDMNKGYFDDFPDVDFEALDRSIQERVQLNQNARHAYATSQTQQLDRQDLIIPPADAPVRNKRKHRPMNQHLSYLTFSRYQVVNVSTDITTFTKTLHVAAWRKEMIGNENSKAIHRRDDYGRNHAVTNVGPKTWPTDGVIHLRGEWYHTQVEIGDPIHICSLMGECQTDSSALPLLLHTVPPPGSDPDDLMLIVHPDLLLIPTTISETVSCTRRAVLKTRLGSTGLANKAALLGTLRHELFEATMKDRNFSIPAAYGYIRNILRENAEGLLASQTTTVEAERELRAFLPKLQQFANAYTSFGPKGPKPQSQFLEIENTMMRPSVRFVAQQVRAIEEPIISPELGLKGNLDLVAHATLVQLDPHSSTSDVLIGIELKTGHNQNTQHAHVAQLALYVLMMHARYGSGTNIPSSAAAVAAASGLLLYVNNNSVRAIHVAPLLSEMKSLIGQRNLVAIEQIKISQPRGIIISYETENDSSKSHLSIDLTEPPPALLPQVLTSAHPCNKCYANGECMVYAASARSAYTADSSNANDIHHSHGEMMNSFTGHLEQDDFAYFLKWERLIDLESDMDSSLPALSWLETAKEKESRTSSSVSSLVFDPHVSSSKSTDQESRYALIALKRSPSSSFAAFHNISMQQGSYVIISSDRTSLEPIPLETLPRPQMYIVRGFLHRINDLHILVRASNEDLERIQYYAQSSDGRENIFRIDPDDSPVGFGTLRQNLIHLLIGDKKPSASTKLTSRLARLRDVIVRLRPPTFDNSMTRLMFSPKGHCPSVPGCDLTDLALEFAELNYDQRSAVEKVMTAQQYCVIQGMPGTGKTSLMTFVARLLAAHGKRVLITAYTHAAVDNVMLKLHRAGVSIAAGTSESPLVRIGQKSSCHRGLYPILASEVAMGMEKGTTIRSLSESSLPSAESLHRCMHAARIVGITALSIPRSSLLQVAQFDVVIVDEAGQISQPAVIGALMAADSFVLVGDHMQLPPLVKSELAIKGGLSVSLMKSLADAHPSTVSQLTYQYRMNEKICELSNDIAYGGKLKCADDKVRYGKLEIKGLPQNLLANAATLDFLWLNQSINPEAAVVFLNTDELGFTETSQGGSIVNNIEASIVRMTVEGLIASGLTPDSVGIICPFRAQLRILEGCSQLKRLQGNGLEISTIDRYQGRDKAVIVVSFVRSNSKNMVGRLLEDYRRLNVAFTRAKFKLILVGSYTTLYEGSRVLRPALTRITNDGGVINVPESVTRTSISFDLPVFSQVNFHGENAVAVALAEHSHCQD